MNPTNYAETKALRTSAKLDEMRDAIRVAASAAYRANQSAKTDETRRVSDALQSLLVEVSK
tara:strand:+ start:662 stop:844 length:183 start_codon:yes stop_codon:yes gene_type:complete